MNLLKTLLAIAIVAVPGLLTVAIIVALIVPKYRRWAIAKLTSFLKSVQENLSLMAQANRAAKSRIFSIIKKEIKMKKLSFVLIAVLMLGICSSVFAEENIVFRSGDWVVGEDVDEMTDEKTFYATSRTNDMSISISEEDDLIIISKCVLDSSTIKVRIDKNIPIQMAMRYNMKPINYRAIIIEHGHTSDMIPQMKSGNVMKIRLDLYSLRRCNMTQSVSLIGFTKAYNKLRELKDN